MYRKIDKLLLQKITTLDSLEKKINVVIKYDNKVEILDKLKSLKIKNSIIDLSFISSIACTILSSELYSLASLSCVKYISSNAKVFSLIYDAKKFIKYDNARRLLKANPTHTCVIIDTGIYTHLDFVLGKNRIVYFKDLINHKQNIYDDNGHGTFVAGVLCGGGIVDKYSGIDNNANVIVVKALDNNGETTTVKILEAMQWVLDNKEKYNIKVVCMSFGSTISSAEDPLVYGAQVLWDNGLVVVSAAGNSGPSMSSIMSPGANKKIITVGSIDTTSEDIKIADFSSRGPSFGNYKPDIVVPGVDIISTKIFKEGKYYSAMSGTSVSTPIVAGVASLLLNYNENYTPDQIKYMILNSGIRITGDRNSEGFGSLDLSKLKLI